MKGDLGSSLLNFDFALGNGLRSVRQEASWMGRRSRNIHFGPKMQFQPSVLRFGKRGTFCNAIMLSASEFFGPRFGRIFSCRQRRDGRGALWRNLASLCATQPWEDISEERAMRCYCCESRRHWNGRATRRLGAAEVLRFRP